jgi:hypothetical protein
VFQNIGQKEIDMQMLQELTLSQLLEDLSEETLFKLLQHVEARTRRATLNDDKQGDLAGLRTLHRAVELRHTQKLDADG